MAQNPLQAHQSPMFLPWHRQFIKSFEADLASVLGVSTYALPYWDWAADQALPDPTKGVVWDNDFMGGTGDPVTSGPFRTGPWTLRRRRFTGPHPGVQGAFCPPQLM